MAESKASRVVSHLPTQRLQIVRRDVSMELERERESSESESRLDLDVNIVEKSKRVRDRCW